MNGSTFNASAEQGFGIIDVADGRSAVLTPDLLATLGRYWNDGSLHTLALRDQERRVTVAIELAKARSFTTPDGIIEPLRELLQVLDPEQVYSNLLHVLREACSTDEIPGVTDQGVAALPVRRVGVVGAGTMGASIAHAYAAAGCRVLLRDVDQEALGRAITTIREIGLTQLGPVAPDADQVEKTVGLVTTQLDADGFDDLDLVVESVPEVLELKKLVFAELDSICAERTILASNTSSLQLAYLATATRRPHKVVGHHFFHPVPLRPMMEIGRTAVTDVETLVTSIAAARMIDKTPLVVPDVTGFLANRVPYPSWLEALLLVEEGASPLDIDRVGIALGLPFGSMHATDMVGHDVVSLAGDVMRDDLSRIRDAPYPVHTTKLVECGRLGVKSGAGYYRYRPGDLTPIPDPDLDPILEEARQERGITRRDDISDLEIAERLMLPTVNHAADALAEGIATTPGQIDVAMVIGYGSPAFMGGPMRSADRLGLGTIVEKLQSYQERLGPRFAPSPYLVELAAAGRGFYGA